MFELLSKKSEAESRLLSGIANKLGDPSRKIASKAGYLLSQLLLEHPAMKPVVVREVRGRREIPAIECPIRGRVFSLGIQGRSCTSNCDCWTPLHSPWLPLHAAR